MRRRGEINHIVLDNEAVVALLGGAAAPKRAIVYAALRATAGRRVVPAPVRVEAGWRRADPDAASANQAVSEDIALDRAAAERAVALGRAVPGASVVDLSVVVAAEQVGRDGRPVVVLTSDPGDMRALAGHCDVSLKVVSL